jgi:hypothetical protein
MFQEAAIDQICEDFGADEMEVAKAIAEATDRYSGEPDTENDEYVDFVYEALYVKYVLKEGGNEEPMAEEG